MEQPGDERIHVTFDHLRRLEGRARNLSFLPRQPSRSVLNGRHASRMRGRGLDFEEIRTYLPGDDIRSIDWKVTARRGTPHVRVFNEERDRPALILVDQRMTMFFGSVHTMKSVTAAEAAALAAFRIRDVGDRVGGIVFADGRSKSFRPERSRRALNAFLSATAAMNRSLAADRAGGDDTASLNGPLASAARMAAHNHLVIVISDFVGLDRETERILSALARHNDVVLAIVHDPMARELPRGSRIVVGDGRLQVQLDLGDRTVVRAMQDVVRERFDAVLALQARAGVAVLPLSAGVATVDQMRHLLGRTARAGARGRATL